MQQNHRPAGAHVLRLDAELAYACLSEMPFAHLPSPPPAYAGPRPPHVAAAVTHGRVPDLRTACEWQPYCRNLAYAPSTSGNRTSGPCATRPLAGRLAAGPGRPQGGNEQVKRVGLHPSSGYIYWLYCL